LSVLSLVKLVALRDSILRTVVDCLDDNCGLYCYYYRAGLWMAPRARLWMALASYDVVVESIPPLAVVVIIAVAVGLAVPAATTSFIFIIIGGVD
jgi:hypothetical protein